MYSNMTRFFLTLSTFLVAQAQLSAGAACVDNPHFVDAIGYRCVKWRGYECTMQVAKKFSRNNAYAPADICALQQKCPAACGLCPKQEGPGDPPFDDDPAGFSCDDWDSRLMTRKEIRRRVVDVTKHAYTITKHAALRHALQSLKPGKSLGLRRAISAYERVKRFLCFEKYMDQAPLLVNFSMTPRPAPLPPAPAPFEPQIHPSYHRKLARANKTPQQDAVAAGGTKRLFIVRRSSAEHLIATKALRCTATAWMLTAAESFAKN